MSGADRDERNATSSSELAEGRPHDWRIWMGAALLIGLLVRGLSWWWLRDAVFCGVPSFEDAVHQSRMITLLTGGFPEGSLPWGSPLYPYFAAAVSAVAGLGLPGLLLVQVAIGLATLPLIAWALRPLLSRQGCWIAALIYGLHPLGAFFEMRLQPLALLIVLLLLAVRLLFLERRGTAGEVLGGLLLGIAFLLRPLPAFALAVAFFWQRWRAGNPATERGGAGTAAPRRRLAFPAAAMLIFPLVLILYHASLPGGGPTWNVSDAAAFHRSLSAETGGAARATAAPVWEEPSALSSVANETLGRRLSAWETATFYRDRALQRFVENPIRVVGNLLNRAALLLSRPELPDPVSAQHVIGTHAPAWKWGLHLFPLFLVLALLGLWLRRSETAMRRLWPALLALVAVNLLGTYSASSRWLLFVLMLPAVAAALLGLPRFARSWRTSPRARLVAIGALALLLLSSLDLPAAHSRYENPAEDLRYRAAVARRLQDQRTATSLLQRAVRVDPANAIARVDLGEVYDAEDLHDAAWQEYEAALVGEPQNARALYNMSEILRGKELFAEAESLAARLVRDHPRHPLYLNQYGVIKMMQGQFGSARYLFEQALGLAPDYQVAQMNLRTLDEAEREAPTLAFPPEMIPPPGSPLLALGFTALQALNDEDWEMADSLTAVAVDSFPDLPMAWYLRGGFFHRAQRYEEAIPHLLRVVAAAPGRALTTQLAARALLAAGEHERALELARENLAQAPDERNRETIERLVDSLVRSAADETR